MNRGTDYTVFRTTPSNGNKRFAVQKNDGLVLGFLTQIGKAGYLATTCNLPTFNKKAEKTMTKAIEFVIAQWSQA